jgi:glycosyltransferase involved in cell wall biosynthesis
MRLVFINRFYRPDEPATAQLLTDLAEGLAARGHEVIVIASLPARAGVARSEVQRGVRIERVRSLRWGRHGAAAKALDFGSFYAIALGKLLRTVRRGDVVIALTDPPLLGIGAWLAARLRGARIIHWVQDIYPEIAAVLSGHRWLLALRGPRDVSWRRADACVTLGQDMAAVLRGAGVAQDKIRVVPNYAQADLCPQPPEAAAAWRAQWGLTGKFVAAYTGNLGRAHDLDILLEVAARLVSEPRIALVFLGGGPQGAALQAEAVRRSLANVQFHPQPPRAQLATALALGDIQWVTLRPGCEPYLLPSKLYSVAAVGRPVLFIGPPACEVAGLVTRHGFGRAFAPGEAGALAQALSDLSAAPEECARLGEAAARFAREGGGSQAAVAAWDGLLKGLA